LVVAEENVGDKVPAEGTNALNVDIVAILIIISYCVKKIYWYHWLQIK